MKVSEARLVYVNIFLTRGSSISFDITVRNTITHRIVRGELNQGHLSSISVQSRNFE
jgi:hypothetical protein